MSLVSRLRELLAEGVPLPWEAPAHREDEDGYSAAIYGNVPEDEQGVADVIRPQDAALIVAAVNALPKLLDDIEKARSLVALHEEYEQFLNEANEGPLSLASIHGWRCPEAEFRSEGRRVAKAGSSPG